MARAFKEITGNITKLNDPYFAEQRGLWVMMVKENDRWIAINSRDEGKIRDYHALLATRRTASTLNITVQATTLSQERVKMGEWNDWDLSSCYPTAMSVIGKPDWDSMKRSEELKDFINPPSRR